MIRFDGLKFYMQIHMWLSSSATYIVLDVVMFVASMTIFQLKMGAAHSIIAHADRRHQLEPKSLLPLKPKPKPKPEDPWFKGLNWPREPCVSAPDAEEAPWPWRIVDQVD